MLKRLAIVVIGGFLAIEAMADQYKPSSSNAAQQSQKKAEQPTPPTSTMTNNQPRSHNEQSSEEKSQGWYKLIAWPEGITTWAILATLGAIIWQSVETKNAARAALLNAQVLINSERPWIMIVIEEVAGPQGGFAIYAKNKGRTPAMIMMAHMGCVAVQTVADLPIPAPYGKGSMVQDRIVVPDERTMVGWFHEGTIKKMIGGNFPMPPWEGNTFIFGKVIYRDLLSSPLARPHETRWVFLYQPPMGESGDSVVQMDGVGIPNDYDRYT